MLLQKKRTKKEHIAGEVFRIRLDDRPIVSLNDYNVVFDIYSVSIALLSSKD